ncbi:13137_t:CDS:2 [Funneliformis geosporum]|nr:13137_t:CDS:2 [Funneliformis geosporum]
MANQLNCQTATLIDDKLYFLDGKNFGNNFFYLDVSIPFNTQKIIWQYLKNLNTVPAHSAATSVKGGANNKTLFLYGGIPINNATMSLVYTFNTQKKSWSIPKITGDNTVRKDNLKGIADNKGLMYLFGGHSNTEGTYFNDMLILDTVNLNWKIGNSVNAPSPRSLYGAALLSNHYIIYLGGLSDEKTIVSLKEVYLYNTINDSWNTKVTLGKAPSNRSSFSAVLVTSIPGLNGQQIIIFGGYVESQDSLYVLDLLNFVWYIPKISGKIPSSRHWHQANVIRKYMVISFGAGYDPAIDDDILLLDISNDQEYVWTNIYDPPTSSKSSSVTLPISAIVGIVIGSLIGGMLLSFGGFFLFIWNKNMKESINTIPKPGCEDAHGQEYIPE